MPAAGAVNRSMAGASVAAPLDALGAIYWNPATLSGLENSDMELGTAVAYTSYHVASFLPTDAFGPGMPSRPMYGRTRSNSGVGLLPAMAVFYKPEDSPWCVAFGGFGAGGLFTNLPATPGNPILSPRPPIASAPVPFTQASISTSSRSRCTFQEPLLVTPPA
jgi:long-chain fatty acid transport protein